MRWWEWSIVALAAVGLGACSRTSAAQEQGGKGSTPMVVKEAPLESEGVIGGEDLAEFRGTVTAISGSQFIVRDENGTEEPFTIDEQTDFIHRGEPVERVQLQEGENVRTRYDERDGEKVAEQVEIY